MFNNPLIERYRYSQLRPRQLWIYLAIYAIVITLILIINWSIFNFQHAYSNRAGYFKSLYYQFLMFQILIMWVWGAINSGSALREEIIQKSYDFFKMIPLSAHDKVTGIVLGKNLVTFMFAAVNAVFLLVFGCMGQVNLLLQLQMALLLVAVAILSSVTALLSSTTQGKKKQAPGAVIMILGGMFLFPFLLSCLAGLSKATALESVCIGFFSARIPVLGLISLLAIYFSAWIYRGCLRQLTLEREPLFTPRGAFLFMIGYILIVLGFFWPHLLARKEYNAADFTALGYGLWFAMFIPLVFLPLGVLKSYDKYIEEAGGTQKFSMLKMSNLSLLLCLFLVWAAAVLGTISIVGITWARMLHFVPVLFSFYLFFILLLELHVVYSPVYNKIQLLIGFIVLIQLILPVIMSPVCSADNIYLFSPLGFTGETFAGNIDKWESTRNMVLALNLILSAVALSLVAKRYLVIASSRQAM